MKYGKFLLLPAVVVAGLILTGVAAALPANANGEDYVFQADDNLGNLAEKYYGTSQAYPAIIEATNNIALEEGKTYTTITDPNNVWIGQKIFVPDYEQVPENLLTTVPLSEYTGVATAQETTPTEEQLKLLASLSSKGVPPELNNQVWLNSDPLKLADLHGKVVIIEFWTFG